MKHLKVKCPNTQTSKQCPNVLIFTSESSEAFKGKVPKYTNIKTISERWKGRNMIFLWKPASSRVWTHTTGKCNWKSASRALTITPRPSLFHGKWYLGTSASNKCVYPDIICCVKTVFGIMGYGHIKNSLCFIINKIQGIAVQRKQICLLTLQRRIQRSWNIAHGWHTDTDSAVQRQDLLTG